MKPAFPLSALFLTFVLTAPALAQTPVQELGYQVWFQPSLDVTRQGSGRIREETVIQPGRTGNEILALTLALHRVAGHAGDSRVGRRVGKLPTGRRGVP